MGYRRLLVPVLLMLLLASGCAPKVSSNDLSTSLDTNSTDAVLEQMEKDENSKNEMWHNLNIARLLQARGQYKESITYFQNAENILNEYEERAKVSVRNVGSGAGVALLSVGAGKYYGKGYERTLMHTLNGLNYIMLGDFEGAAIEMRKMEKRQEFWLAESEARIKEAAEKKSTQKDLEGKEVSNEPPANYSMRAMLDDPDVKSMINNYQDPFSYTMSTIFAALIQDKAYSEVSCRRALLLNPNAEAVLNGLTLTSAMAHEIKTQIAAEKPAEAVQPGQEAVKPESASEPALDPKPVVKPAETKKSKKSKKSKKGKAEDKAAAVVAPAPVPECRDIDVLVVALTGRAPALKVEQLPFPIGDLNYTTFELPALAPVQGDMGFTGVDYNGQSIPAVKLLSSDKMAYKTLRDEMPGEVALAIVRAVAKGAAAYTAEQAGGAFAGLAASILLHVTSYQMQLGYRNWELLPNSGYMTAFHVKREENVSLHVVGQELTIPVQEKQKGIIVLVSALSPNNVRVDHVSY